MGKYKNRSALSTASVAVDDGNRFVIDIDNAEFFFLGGERNNEITVFLDK